MGWAMDITSYAYDWLSHEAADCVRFDGASIWDQFTDKPVLIADRLEANLGRGFEDWRSL